MYFVIFYITFHLHFDKHIWNFYTLNAITNIILILYIIIVNQMQTMWKYYDNILILQKWRPEQNLWINI